MGIQCGQIIVLDGFSGKKVTPEKCYVVAISICAEQPGVVALSGSPEDPNAPAMAAGVPFARA